MLTLPVYYVESVTVGKIQITVNDPNKPFWKGDYQTGKLAIYLADICLGYPLVPVTPVIYIISNQDLPELNCMGYQVYAKVFDPMSVKADLMLKIDAHYMEHLIEYKKQNEEALLIH